MEYRMMKGPPLPDSFSIRHSLLDIRYSFRKQGKFIFGEIPAGEDLAKSLPRFALRVFGGIRTNLKNHFLSLSILGVQIRSWISDNGRLREPKRGLKTEKRLHSIRKCENKKRK
jgi:hypothetical protein